MSDYLTGHAPATVARGYGAPTISDMAEALKNISEIRGLKDDPPNVEGAAGASVDLSNTADIQGKWKC